MGDLNAGDPITSREKEENRRHEGLQIDKDGNMWRQVRRTCDDPWPRQTKF